MLIYDTNEILKTLIECVSEMKEVQSIGISGSKTELPKAGEGDIDCFIYCDSIPDIEARKSALDQLSDLLQKVNFNVFEGGHWGTGDLVHINGVETWLMYFSTDETIRDTESILSGDYPDRLDNYYYPIGRCAMLSNINILHDKNGFLSSLKVRLSQYPDKLAKVLIPYHLDFLDDTEDLERAVFRKDVLFYHFALDIAVDHFLQALFAMNKTYFPSRKRTLELIKSFKIMPESSGERLLDIIKAGACPESIGRSYEAWAKLAEDLKNIYK